MKNLLPYYLSFSYCPHIGPVRFKKLIERFGDVKNSYHATLCDLKKTIGIKSAIYFDKFRHSHKTDSMHSLLFNNRIHILCYGMSHYPHYLVHINDPPICVYVLGNLELFIKNALFFSIIGSRKPSLYGEKTASEFSSYLGKHDYVIVSGMAIGIDAIAHIHSEKTVAVLGGAIDKPYPLHNAWLYDEIVKHKGAVISEFPPGVKTQPWHFVSRNRIISGLSKGVLVVEGAERSGTLITARYAADQGRDVFAIPGQIDSVLSKAPNFLIRSGARAALSPQDIIDEYSSEKKSPAIPHDLSDSEKKVCTLLHHSSLSIALLSQQLQIPIQDILITLTTLELKGVIEKNDQEEYHISNNV